MNYDDLLLFTMNCGYVSAQTAALRFAQNFDEIEVQRSYFRAKKLILKAVANKHLRKYSKKQGLAIFALTRSGASHLTGQGYDNVKSTVKSAYESKHVYHRLVADAFCLALNLYARKACTDADLTVDCLFERSCLQASKLFEKHFKKVPDACFLIEKNMTWIEVDTARKKMTDMDRLIYFIKFFMCLNEDSDAVKDLANPTVLLWVCSRPAAINALNKLRKNFTDADVNFLVESDKQKGTIITIDSGSIVRSIVLIKFDFKSVADLHLRAVQYFKEAVENSLPCSI